MQLKVISRKTAPLIHDAFLRILGPEQLTARYMAYFETVGKGMNEKHKKK